MPLKLVLGPANSAKAGEVLGAFADASRAGALLVVPRARDAEHYGRELAEQGCVLRAVLTFGGLCAEIARRAGFDSPRCSPLQRERLLRRAIERCSLRALAPAAQTPGFVGAAGGLVAELGRSMVSAPRFAQAMAAWARADSRREAHAREVSAIYLAYERELEASGLLDPERFAWRALDALRSAPARWGPEPVFFYGFDDLHELEQDAIETLSARVGIPVTVSLTFEAGRAATAARAGVVEELRAVAQSVVELAPLDDYYEPGSRAVLHHLERSLFEPGPTERPEPGGAVVLLEAAGELAEAELVAAQISSLLEGGMRPAEIAVVYRSAPPAAALGGTFARYGVPFELQRRVPFGHTTLGRGVLALGRLAWSGAPAAEDLLRYLRTPGLLECPEVVDALEVAIRCEGLADAARARERLGFELSEIDSLARAEQPLSELVRRARRLLAAPHRRQAAVLSPQEMLDASALRSLVELSRQLEELGEAPSGSETIELLEQLEVVQALDGEGVLVTDALSIRARRYRVVFVCGLNEGSFPVTPAPDPFLPDELRRELAVASGLRLRPGGDALERERYLFYACVSRATERVVLSYQSSDEEGNLALPSPFVDDVAELLDPAWPASRRKRLLSDVVWSEAEAPTPHERARAVATSRAGTDGAGVRGAGAARRLSDRVLPLVRHTRMVSAGALETYAQCPVKWLIERQLGPRELEPEDDPLARGSYMHDVLERVLSGLGRAVSPESLPDALRQLERVLAEDSPRIAVGRSDPLRRAMSVTIAADLRRYLEHEARTGCGWQPRALELRFGFEDEEQSLPPLVLSDDGEEVRVRGAIDRVDVDPTGRQAVVHDYKSGPARSEHQGSRWSIDQRLQVAIYMLAVHELLGLDPVGGLYQPLGGKDLRARGIYLEGAPVGGELVSRDGRDAEGLRAELDQARARAVSLAARLRSGEVVPCPQSCSRDGCSFPGICRSQS